MIIDTASIASLQRGFNRQFQEAYAGAQPLSRDLVMMADSETEVEEYIFFDILRGMEEWKDEIPLGNIELQEWSIENQDWQNSVQVQRNKIADDKIGAYTPVFRLIGETAATHPDGLYADLLYNGFSADSYDGEYFFDSDHPVPGSSSTQSNVGSSALSEAAFEAGISALEQLKIGNGGLYPNRGGSMKLKLVVPPSLRATAEDITLASQKSSGATNVNQGKAEPVVIPELEEDSSTAWYLINTGRAVGSVIYQMRERPVVNTDNDAKSKFILFFVTGRWAMGYGLYHFAYGSTGTG